MQKSWHANIVCLASSVPDFRWVFSRINHCRYTLVPDGRSTCLLKTGFCNGAVETDNGWDEVPSNCRANCTDVLYMQKPGRDQCIRRTVYCTGETSGIFPLTVFRYVMGYHRALAIQNANEAWVTGQFNYLNAGAECWLKTRAWSIEILIKETTKNILKVFKFVKFSEIVLSREN